MATPSLVDGESAAASLFDGETAAREVRVFSDPDELAEAAADLVLEAAQEAIAARGAFRIALAGGSTPRRLYQKLAALAASREKGTGALSSDPSAASAMSGTETDTIPGIDAETKVRDSGASPASARFEAWHVFFGDERFVPPDHPDSNYRMAREALLDHVGIPAAQVHRIEADAGSPGEVAKRYAATISREFDLRAGELPRFDLVLLGMGADGHTASLFPGTTALDAAPGETVVCTWVEKLSAWRVTLTFEVINAARLIVFVLSGPEKLVAFGSVLHGTASLPAAKVRPADGSLVFLVEEGVLPRAAR